jgi:ectoine hydroxylase-related dioxygenase (phytanoyl-CoA dioxygenase family)
MAVLKDRVISDEDIETFRSEGAVVLRGLLSPEMLDLLRRAYDEMADEVDDTGHRSRDGRRNMMMADTARINADVRRFLRESPGPAAAAAMGSATVRLYEDLLFVKETGALASPTPWHQDASHWPVKGSMMSSLWVSLDEATADTGAMKMVVGSHLRPLHTPAPFSVPAIYHHLITEEEGGPLPDPDAEPDAWPTKFYEARVGDAVLFHPAMLHSAPGAANSAARRTFTFRMLGDDIRWFHRDIVMQEHIRAVELKDGDPIDAAGFPVLWPPERRTI